MQFTDEELKLLLDSLEMDVEDLTEYHTDLGDEAHLETQTSIGLQLLAKRELLEKMRKEIK